MGPGSGFAQRMVRMVIDPKRLVPVVLTLCLVTCSTRANDSVRAIPGTEQVAIFDFCISVSPDERWLVFTEWVLPKSQVFDDLPPGQYYSRVVTLDIGTGEMIHHTIDTIPAEALGFSNGDTGWIRQAGTEIVEDRFRPAGWIDGKFYFQPYNHGVQVWLDPQMPGIVVGAGPDTVGRCSDCPPLLQLQFARRAWDLTSDYVSAVLRNGMFQSIYYRREYSQRSSAIVRTREDGGDEVVVERQHKKGTFMTIMSVRVSPDERYLAYVVHSKKDGLMSGPREELFVKDLENGAEKRVATYAYMGNLIWSPMGERLYFAGGAYSSDSAVRVVDANMTFSK